jgi:hypothetical protein
MILCVATCHAQQAASRPQGLCHVLSVAPPRGGVRILTPAPSQNQKTCKNAKLPLKRKKVLEDITDYNKCLTRDFKSRF